MGIIASWVLATVFAVNIGASGTAAAMGSAYGGGAVNRRLALVLVAVFAFLGAVVIGLPVTTTISGGLIPAELFRGSGVIVILLAATSTLFLANILGIPLSTSEVTVGSLVGYGLVYGLVYTEKLLAILAAWVVIPLAAFSLAYLLRRLAYDVVERWIAASKTERQARRLLAWILGGAGCYEAFAAGSNNVANAIGPLVGAGILDSGTGIVLGGLALASGALTLGQRVLETNGKKITNLCLISASFVSVTSGSLVLAGSWLGLPVPLTQATTMAIVGAGCARNGRQVWQSSTVKSILVVWLASPVLSLGMAYSIGKALAG